MYVPVLEVKSLKLSAAILVFFARLAAVERSNMAPLRQRFFSHRMAKRYLSKSKLLAALKHQSHPTRYLDKAGLIEASHLLVITSNHLSQRR
jgi:hypothetical protein